MKKHFPKSLNGIFDFLVKIKIPYKFIFLAMGLASTVWFLIRVIPKPSRAEYPCIKAASPFMSSFVIYLLSLGTTVFAFRKAKSKILQTRYLAASGFVLVAMAAGVSTLIHNYSTASAVSTNPTANAVPMIGPNQPVGVAQGIFPGRVVWVWDSLATNENCTGVFNDGWYMDKNTDMIRVDSMLIKTVLALTGKPTISESWDTLFRYFNAAHEKGNVSYREGEKIYIKFNNVGGHAARMDSRTHARKANSRYANSQASAQVGLALLRQLINGYGVPQENITIGDPSKHLYKDNIDMWRNEFPDVHYIGSTVFLATGQEAAVKGAAPRIFYSDKGTSGLGYSSDYIPTAVEEASYVINLAALKGHFRGGVTSCAKNHFGTQMRGAADHLHNGLIGADDTTKVYGKYKVLVDMMGHELLGGNTMLFIVDGLWAGADANYSPDKWSEPPFNGDWTSSVFASQDHVAIESVCLDFLRSHYRVETMPDSAFPQYHAADDYLMQAASSAYWPAGISYDPEGDGTPIQSLGVFEHWNNPVDKQYSRNLKTGEGIELFTIFSNKLYILDSPGNLAAGSVSVNSIDLSWSDNSNCESEFSIEVSADGLTDWILLAQVGADETSYSIADLLPNTNYYFRIRAITDKAASEYSGIISASTLVDATSVSDASANIGSLKTFPNPFLNACSISLSNSYSGEISISIIDLSGRAIYSTDTFKSSGAFTTKLDLERIKPGAYVVRVKMGNEYLTTKINKEF